MKTVLIWLTIGLIGWFVVTNEIFSLSHPELTNTQVFLHIPRTVTLDFKP